MCISCLLRLTPAHCFRMDSFFLAEMFKYLYLLFSEKSQLPFDIDDYIFTTEAHLLPMSLSITQPPCQGNGTVRGPACCSAHRPASASLLRPRPCPFPATPPTVPPPLRLGHPTSLPVTPPTAPHHTPYCCCCFSPLPNQVHRLSHPLHRLLPRPLQLTRDCLVSVCLSVILPSNTLSLISHSVFLSPFCLSIPQSGSQSVHCLGSFFSRPVEVDVKVYSALATVPYLRSLVTFKDASYALSAQ